MSKRSLKTGTSEQAIQAHYDLSNDFYQLWLDQNMVYSGAIWHDGDDLEQAQIRKLEHHIRAAGVTQDMRVLDIGCGWGALLTRLATQHHVKQAVGLTLSKAQLEWIEKFSSSKIEVRLEHWQDHTPIAPYDAIISIGAFEHFAKLDMSEEEKVSAYRIFFRKCQQLLVKGGSLSLQSFAYGSKNTRDTAISKNSTKFLSEQVFNETDPPRLANIAEAIQGYFEISNMQNDRLGYARTCKVWLDNLRTQEKKVIAMLGKEIYERYQTYLSYSYIGFKTGNLDLYRITLKRITPQRTFSV